jgi:hypothetical protein
MTVPSSVVVLLKANSVAYFEKSGIFLPVCIIPSTPKHPIPSACKPRRAH